MPYIPQKDRERASRDPFTSGELNYAITKLIHKHLEKKDVNYSHINDVMGALEGAKLEFYRRVVAPYEDKKLTENGDI